MSKQSIRDRFMSKICKDKSGCWLWTRGQDKDGYGHFSIKHKIYRAHRMSYILHIGKIPRGCFVCHACDVPACVNPEHLFIGTVLDNYRDSVKKGRRNHVGQKGINNWACKLTDEQVEAIRRLRAAGMRLREISSMFDMSISRISQITTRKAWTHVA